jgi:hypothetical protein
MIHPWRGLYVSRQWVDSPRIRARIAAGAWAWLGGRVGLVLRAQWSALEPTGPVADYPVFREALAWAQTLPCPVYIGIGCVGAITHHTDEIPPWTTVGVQTIPHGERDRLVPWDPTLRTHWLGFLQRVAAVVRPIIDASPLHWGTIGVAAPGQDAEMHMIPGYVRDLRAVFSDQVVGDGCTSAWRTAFSDARATWGADKILTVSPGTIDIAGRVVTREILDPVIAEPGTGLALGNGNLASYPDNQPSQWQRAYLDQCPLVGLTESPEGGADPAVALDAERVRVVEPLRLYRVTMKPDAAGVGAAGASPAHQVTLRRLAAYLQRDI